MKYISKLILILFIAISPLHAQQIILPVEVLGAEGKVVTRTFNLTSQEASSAVKLWLQINNLSYQNKASIKINNGAWLSLNHQTVTMQAQEKARGGMVHGGFNTVRLSIPATGFVAGANTIYFRFDLSDAISNGYRVVRFNLLDAGSNKILAADRFKEDDPKTWLAPFTDAASINEGRNLWYNAALKSNYLPTGRNGFWYSASIKPNELIKATCSNCHTQDGRDLEIFSYSNEAIVERAKFHQLSEIDGQKIASYIRSLSTTKPNVGRWGRPWNPPYQPGPAVANMPVQQWAAGAGLDAVLDEDKDMLPYLFPNGVNQDEVYKHFDSDKTLDRTTLPLAIQFPDWKHWLPLIHPMDAYSKNDYYNTPKQYDPKKGYTDFRNYLTAQDPATRNKADLMNKSNEFRTHYRFFLAQGSPVGNVGGHWREPNGTATANLTDGVSREMAATSLARLLAVQYFEIFNEFNLQDKASWFTQPNEYPEDLPKTRQWFGNDYHVFEVPAHFQACVNNNCNQFMGQPTETGFYESTNWYHLQLVIGGGEGMMSWNSPVDYNYHPDFLTKSSNSSGIYEPLRYYHSMNAMYQTRTWVGGQNPNNGLGFRIRVMGPWNIYGISDGNQFNGFAPGEFAKLLDKVEPGMTAWVMNAMLKQFLKELNKPYNSLDKWNRVPDGDDNALDRADKKYADIIDAVQRTERQEGFFYHHAAKMYYYIPRFQKLGVDCQIMEDWITWCQKAWPLIDWSVFRNKGEMQLSLLMADNKFCSGTNTIKAIGANIPANAVYTWKVNGNTVSANGSEVSTSNLAAGDVVTCQVSSTVTCLANKTVTATLAVPSKGYNLTTRKVGEANFSPLENMDACTNDKIEFKLNIDLQPKQWLDAMDVNAGAEPANGSRIASWWDKTGHGFNADANKTELQPKYVSNGLNGLPAIVFGADNNADGLELFSTSEDAFMNNDWTIMFVGQSEKPTGNDDWRDIIGNKTEGSNGWFWRFGSNARVQMGIGPELQHGKEYNFNRSYIVQITKKGDVITCYLNGKSDRVITKGANVAMRISDALYIGQSAGGNQFSSRYHKGPISELLVFESAITDAQKEFLEGYLTNKWKLNNELDYTHSYYKNSPFDISLNTPNGDKYNFNAISTTHTINLDQVNKFGTYNFVKEVCGASVETISITNGCNTTQSPYGGTPWPIPGIIQAENYDDGGEGVAYHDNDPVNSGGQQRTNQGVDVENTGDTEGGQYNVGWTNAGEWMEYTVDVTTAGTYALQARVASPATGNSIRVEMDGTTIGTITIPNTGGWQTYQTASVTTPSLSTGQHVVRIFQITGGFNINYINFIPTTQTPVITSAGTANGITGSSFTYSISASNTPTSYAASGLPAGLTVNTTTGVISGTPTTTGSYTATVSATNAAGTGSKTITITIAPQAPVVSSAAIASGTVGTAFSYTILASNTPTSYAASGLPAGLTVDATTGVISGTPTTAGSYTTTVSATNAGGTGTKAVSITINAQAQTPYGGTPWPIPGKIEVENYDNGGEGVAYHDNETTNYGGFRPTEGVDVGNCPDGTYNIGWIGGGEWTEYTVNVATTGIYTLQARVATPNPNRSFHIELDGVNISGAIAVPLTGSWDTYQTVSVVTSSLTPGQHILRMFIDAGDFNINYINFVSTAAPVVSSVGTVTGTAGTTFTYTVTASNFPTSYGATGLPAGLAVNTTTGVISGIPTTAGSYTATVSATNTGGTGTKTVTFTINPAAPVVSSSATASGTVGTAFSYTITASNNPASYAATGLPAGLSINLSTGLISGTPTTAATYTTTVSATNAGGTGTKIVTITIHQVVPVISSAATASGTVGTAFSYTITASNNPTSYSASGLPAGLTLNTNTGIISGTPTTAGNYNITVNATNAGGTGTKQVAISISNPAGSTPYGGIAWAIPGTIQAENYDDGGEGIAYHDNDPINSGGQQRTNHGVDVETTGDAAGGTYNVGWTVAGEWLNYTVNVAATKSYTLDVRVASPNTGKSLHVEMDGITIATVAIPNTNGWQTYQTVSVPTSSITAGSHIMRIVMDTDGFNLNSVTFRSTTVSAPVITSSTSALATLGVPFNYNITASNTPTSYSATGLPSGLSVNSSTGVISGTPLNSGTSNVTITAANATGTGSATLALTVSAAIDAAGVITCYKAPASITVNGNLSEAGWDVTRQFSKTVFGTANNTSTFGVMWDNTNLYIGAKIIDANLYSDSQEWWEDDAVEVYIDANYNRLNNYDGFDNQIIKGYNKMGVSTKLAIAGLQHAVVAISGGYAVELAIPWSQLGISAPAPGRNLGFDIGYNDDDNGSAREGQAMWNGTVDNWQNTSGFGRLTLNAGFASRVSNDDMMLPEVNRVEIYPNPVTGELLSAVLPDSWNGNAEVLIRNINGIVVQSNISPIINHKCQLDVSALDPGIYFIQLSTGGNTVTEKFVIN